MTLYFLNTERIKSEKYVTSFSLKITFRKHFFSSLLSFILFSSVSVTYASDEFYLMTKEEFSLYQNVAEFIERSPKVTIVVPAQQSDVDEYGKDVVKTLTGSDCDRDGLMDDNQTCNAVYYKLWFKYKLKNKGDKS
ncbi:MAG: hypothetical protein WBC60_10595 [Cognaticolwellia sp.]